MNETQLGVIALLKSAITQKAETLPEQFDIEAAYPILRRHGAVAMGYMGALCCGIPKELPAMQKLRMDYYAAALKSEGQMAAVKKLTKAFDENGIDYMLLKGCNMKALYPAHELRSMGDADVLIRLEQYPKIRTVLQELGFEEGGEIDHEIVWKTKALYLELHKRLIPSTEADYYQYYGDGWGFAKAGNGHSHKMTDEDAFIFIFTHFTKHYRDFGIGCRHVVDLWVYLRSYPNLDEAYIKKELKELGLYDFYCNMRNMICAWFEEGTWDDKAELITNVVFANGNWGNAKNHMLSEVVRSQNTQKTSGKSKVKWFWDLIFLPIGQMRYRYPVLKRYPVLLPLCWVARWFDILFRRSGNIASNYKRFVYTTVEEIETHEQALSFVGLRFEK